MIKALKGWTSGSDRDPRRTYFWICSFSLNQHGLNGLPRGDDVGVASDHQAAERLAKGFDDRVVGIGRILPMLNPWDDPGYVKRAWCLFELYTAVTKRIDIDVIVSASETQSFRQALATKGYGVVDEVLSQIDGDTATATHPLGPPTGPSWT